MDAVSGTIDNTIGESVVLKGTHESTSDIRLDGFVKAAISLIPASSHILLSWENMQENCNYSGSQKAGLYTLCTAVEAIKITTEYLLGVQYLGFPPVHEVIEFGKHMAHEYSSIVYKVMELW